MQANNRPALNCCSSWVSILASFFRSSRIRLTWLDCFLSAASSGSFWDLVTGWAYYEIVSDVIHGLHVSEIMTYVSLVPLSEGGGINVDDTGLDKGLGSEKLVVGGIVSLSKYISLIVPHWGSWSLG